jgi:hypothetical protein
MRKHLIESIITITQADKQDAGTFSLSYILVHKIHVKLYDKLSRIYATWTKSEFTSIVDNIVAVNTIFIR